MNEFWSSERGIPPRVNLYPAVTQLAKKRWHEAVQQYADGMGDFEKRHDFNKRIEEYRSTVDWSACVETDTTKVPVEFFDADHVAVQSIGMTPGRQGEPPKYVFVDLSLFADGSPLMFEEDLAEIDNRYPIGSIYSKQYSVFASPECPPFLVSGEIIDPEGGWMDDYLSSLQQKGESPRWLNDQQSQTVIGLVMNAQLDLEATVEIDLR